MGEWGKWWSSRGHDQNVKCVFCGRNVPKHKSVQVSSSGRLSRDIYEVAEVISIGGVKSYSCISCAKHRHLVKEGIHTTERERLAKERAREKREMEKIMAKVKEMEKKDGIITKVAFGPARSRRNRQEHQSKPLPPKIAPPEEVQKNSEAKKERKEELQEKPPEAVLAKEDPSAEKKA